MRHFVHIGSVISLYDYRVGYCAFLCVCCVFVDRESESERERVFVFFCVYLCLCACLCVCVIKKRYFLCVCFSYIAACIYQVLE